MERKEIIKRVKKILSKHEENTSEGAIYWNFEWVGGKEIPTGRGGYIQEGGERVYSDKAFYEEMADFISQELDKAREEGRREVYEAIVFDENIPHDITTFVAANLWKNMRDKAKEELSKLKQ